MKINKELISNIDDQDNFESPILKAGETYASNTIIKLSNNY